MPPSPKLAIFTDEQLVHRFREGLDAEGAFLDLYERHRTETYAFFRRRIGSPDLAAEQNQDLYMKVVQHLESFRGECSFRTWLFQIAHHQLSHLRRRWSVHVDERADEIPEELWSQLRDPDQTDPEDEAGRSQVVKALRRCIWSLPELERAVIFGQYYEGVTLRELTDHLRLDNRSGARGSLIAAQRRLRACLQRAGIGSVDGGASEGGGDD